MDALGHTNQSLADKAGIPVATVNRIVAGQTENPSVQTLTALASALDMTMDEIVGLAISSETPIQPSPVVNMYETMTQTLQAVHRSGIQELRNNHAEELRRMEEKYREELRTLQEQHRLSVEALERKHADAIERLEAKHRESACAKDRWIARQFWLRLAMTLLLFLAMAWALIMETRVNDFGLIQW